MSDAAATVSGMGDDVEVVFFADAAAFRAWLEEHHATATELWMGLRRKGHPDRGLTWEDAVPEALCFGWIDSTSYRIDDEARRQRWTPRKPTSNWSAVNIAHVERLLAEGRMHPAGIAAFERRDKSVAGYSYETRRELGADGLAAIAAVPAAQAFWEAAPPSYRRVAGNWVLSAKREQTRADRLATLVADCAAGRLIPPQRYGDEPRWVARAAAASGRPARERQQPRRNVVTPS
ncbi:YdeI/OmpD-associated family protein [Microbacterium aurum]